MYGKLLTCLFQPYRLAKRWVLDGSCPNLEADSGDLVECGVSIVTHVAVAAKSRLISLTSDVSLPSRTYI